MPTITIKGTRSFSDGQTRNLPEQSFDSDMLSKEQILWLVERGAEESARNSYAGHTEKRHEGIERAWLESVKAWESWFNQLRAGEVLSGGGGGGKRLSLFDECLRDVIADFVRAQSEAVGVPQLQSVPLTKLAADLQAASEYAAKHLTKRGTTAEQFRAAWTTAAEKLEATRKSSIESLPKL